MSNFWVVRFILLSLHSLSSWISPRFSSKWVVLDNTNTNSDSEGKMGAYKFGDKKKDHKFCKDCGSSIMIDFNRPTATGETDHRKDMVAINVSLDVASFKIDPAI